MGTNRFRQFLEHAKTDPSYFIRAFALEALAHTKIPDPASFGDLEAWRTSGHFIASQDVARKAWKAYIRWIADQPDGEERAR